MGLLDFNKPKWLHKDAETRRAAVAQLNPTETEILGKLALEDEEQDVRLAAIGRIFNIEVLEKLAEESTLQKTCRIYPNEKKSFFWSESSAAKTRAKACMILQG